MSSESVNNVDIIAAKLAAHENLCLIRYENIDNTLTNIKDLLNKMLYGAIGLLICIIGWLLVNGSPYG